MKNNIYKKIMVTGLISTLCMGGITPSYFSNNTSSNVVYADKINYIDYSANGKTTTNLTVRVGPSTNFAKLGSLKKDSFVIIVGKYSNNWYKIKFNNSYGYVSGQYIKIVTNPQNPTETPYSANGQTTVNLSVRKGAGTSFTKIGSLAKGSKVTIVAKTSNNWYKIRLSNGYGYISAYYVTFNNEIPYNAIGVLKFNMNLRKQPDINSQKIGYLKKGSLVDIVALNSNNWCKIKYNNGYAYLSTEYMDIIAK